MTIKQKIDEIIAFIDFLKFHINSNVKQSFTDLTFDLEKVIEGYLNVFEKPDEQFTNINIQYPNYPAIDLINKKKDIAIQVTTNADSIKVKHTMDTYHRHGLQHSRLIIIGFLNATGQSYPGVEIYDSKYLINLAKGATESQLEQLYIILRNRIPLNILNPLNDKHCFSVVLDVINRSAIRDLTASEGNYDRMFEGLSEIKEIITSGYVKGKNIRAKALVEYTDPIKRKLRTIEHDVSVIMSICNENMNRFNSQFICLTDSEKNQIDKLKIKIMTNANALSDDLGLGEKISGSDSYRY